VNFPRPCNSVAVVLSRSAACATSASAEGFSVPLQEPVCGAPFSTIAYRGAFLFVRGRALNKCGRRSINFADPELSESPAEALDPRLLKKAPIGDMLRPDIHLREALRDVNYGGAFGACVLCVGYAWRVYSTVLLEY